ncbi:hypothetical protein S7335_3175 [Synechococcus sp. PCC 7335]|uniref:hypothetical protein n=1 Tax=Synechococcus sp. (strain ATCC 29403 / PCC 7335) TaxID=91464 RepID=UPI00017EE41C|nr:hypothetical protein [Synechococcus sp. PCC 7335]EDX85474.1 hypothetical protein S7335_3175 [Synechococcus sp. PCC 7335]
MKGVIGGISAIALLILCASPGQADQSRRRSFIAVSDQVNLNQVDHKQLASKEGTAEDLQLSPASGLQGGDLSELPVLEPSVPLDQPVSVPPIAPLETSASPTTTQTTEPDESVAEVPNEPEIPLEPPFIGDLTQTAATETISAETLADSGPPPTSSVAVDPAAADSAVVDARPVVTSSTTAAIPIVRPANVSRWPDPIPFGQPLPDN